MNQPKVWHSRGYLPHFDHPEVIQSITFRLADAVPAAVMESWLAELKLAGRESASDLRNVELRRRIERFADQGHGACWLRQPPIAEMVQNALLHFDAERYRLQAWSILPNHVHVMAQALPGFRIGEIVHSWKSFTAKKLNQILNRTGEVWQADYFDRFIRDENHFSAVRRYIEENPVQAGLVAEASQWPWSSCYRP